MNRAVRRNVTSKMKKFSSRFSSVMIAFALIGIALTPAMPVNAAPAPRPATATPQPQKAAAAENDKTLAAMQDELDRSQLEPSS